MVFVILEGSLQFFGLTKLLSILDPILVPACLHFASKNLTKSYLGGVLGHLGGVLGALGVLLRPLWGLLEASWGILTRLGGVLVSS